MDFSARAPSSFCGTALSKSCFLKEFHCVLFLTPCSCACSNISSTKVSAIIPGVLSSTNGIPFSSACRWNSSQYRVIGLRRSCWPDGCNSISTPIVFTPTRLACSNNSRTLSLWRASCTPNPIPCLAAKTCMSRIPLLSGWFGFRFFSSNLEVGGKLFAGLEIARVAPLFRIDVASFLQLGCVLVNLAFEVFLQFRLQHAAFLCYERKDFRRLAADVRLFRQFGRVLQEFRLCLQHRALPADNNFDSAFLRIVLFLELFDERSGGLLGNAHYLSKFFERNHAVGYEQRSFRAFHHAQVWRLLFQSLNGFWLFGLFFSILFFQHLVFRFDRAVALRDFVRKRLVGSFDAHSSLHKQIFCRKGFNTLAGIISPAPTGLLLRLGD